MKICLIVNPNAGPIAFKNQLRDAQDYLLKQGCELKRVDTQKKGDATLLARQAVADGFDVVVAVGGDGTVNEVCNGLANTSVAMGVLPAGTANVFAADVGIPIWSPLALDAVIKGAEIIATGPRRVIDLGQVRLEDNTSRYFLMWCGVGLDAAITQSKPPSGGSRSVNYASWLIASMMVIYDFMGTRATITMDEGVVRQRLLMAVVSNGQLYGRVWRLAPEAKLDDGLLDVAIMVGHRWPSTFKHVLGLTLGRHVQDPDFHLHRTRRLTLSAKEKLPVHADAEIVGHTPVEVEVAPGALTVIVPPDAPARLFEKENR